MKLAILGATGRTGVPLVAQALLRGHTVTALARSEDKAASLLDLSHDELTLIEGDLLDPGPVGKVIVDAEVVLNVAGQVKGAPQDLQQRAIRNVLDAMVEHDVKRLVTLTGAGVRVEGDQPGLVDRFFGAALKLAQGALLEDSVAYVNAVRASDRDWTVVRAPRLVDGEPKGSVRIRDHVGQGTKTSLTRSDLAATLLDMADDPATIGKAPVVSN